MWANLTSSRLGSLGTQTLEEGNGSRFFISGVGGPSYTQSHCPVLSIRWKMSTPAGPEQLRLLPRSLSPRQRALVPSPSWTKPLSPEPVCSPWTSRQELVRAITWEHGASARMISQRMLGARKVLEQEGARVATGLLLAPGPCPRLQRGHQAGQKA